MTTSFTPYVDVNSLDEFSMIAGTNFIITFNVYEEDCVTPLDLTGATIKWVLSPYGETSYRIITKTGVISGVGEFYISLVAADTISLSGKYIHQPIITDFAGKIFRPAQGTILIMPQIPVA